MVTKRKGTKNAYYKSHRANKTKHSFGLDKEKSVFRSNIGRLGNEDEDLKM